MKQAQAKAQAQVEDWEAAEEAWQWDGRDVADIMIRIPLIRDLFPHKLTEWEHTVPKECRGKVSVESGNPTNSEETLYRSAEVLAVDGNGNALVLEVSHNTYTDAEGIKCLVMPVDAGISLIQSFKDELEDEVADDANYLMAPGM